MRHLDLFSGIGGFALAVEAVWPDAEHIFCDNDPFCQAILKKHWPQSKIYGDIRSLTNTKSEQTHPTEQSGFYAKPSLQDSRIDLLTGGFPCQPFSHAGKRKGTNDDRHLWPEMRRVIQEFTPRFVVAENVRGLLSIDGGMVFEQVCLDLEALDYEVQPFVIPAVALGAPHRRDRVWIVAHAKSDRGREKCGDISQTDERQTSERQKERVSQSLGSTACNTKHDGWNGTEDGESGGTGSDRDTSRAEEDGESTGSIASRDNASDGSRGWERSSEQKGDGTRESEISSGDIGWNQDWPTVATRLCSLDDGLQNGLARPRGWRNAALKAAGNAIVPQVAIQILQAIKLCPSQSKT